MNPQGSGTLNNLVRQAHDSEVQFGTYHGYGMYSEERQLILLARIEDLLKKGREVIMHYNGVGPDIEMEDIDQDEEYEKVLAEIVYVVFDIAGAHDFDFDAAVKAMILRKFKRPPTAPAGPPPPLNCDCYAGCWAEHSEGWPEIASGWRQYCVDHFQGGSYVIMKDCIRVHHSSLIDQVNEAYGDMMKPKKLEAEKHREAVERLTNTKPVTQAGGADGEAS